MAKKKTDCSLKKFSSGIGQNWYHIVLVPKKRFPVFQWKETHELAQEAFTWICERHKVEVFRMEIMEDHVHLFVDCPPDYGIRKLLKILKGGSSYYIRKNYPSLKKYKSLWNGGHMYRGVSNVTAETVDRYIVDSNNWVGQQK